MGDRIGMSISADSPSDETLNRGPLALLLRRQYEFPFGINIVHFLIFNFLRISALFCPIKMKFDILLKYTFGRFV